MLAMSRDFSSDKRGVTLVEYALLAGLVSLTAVVLLTAMGGSVKNLFSTVNTKLTSA